MILAVNTPKKVWFDHFRNFKIGENEVHSELIEVNRFETKEGCDIELPAIESAFGKIIAQGESFEEDFDVHSVFIWTEHWVGMVDNNHGTESIYWVPRNPVEELNHGESPRSGIFEVWHIDPTDKQGDFIANGLCKFGSAYGSIFWTNDYVYVHAEIEYEGETTYFRGFPRNPKPDC